jgi:aminoglycoside phosphotransferase (APT) family kinase protein
MGSLGPLISQGTTAEIHLWCEDQVLKLFWDWAPAAAVHHEACMARVIHSTGVPSPAVGDVLEVTGRLGIAYQRVDGPTMAERLLSRPWGVRRWAHLLAELHADMHARRVPAELPSLRDLMQEHIPRAPGLPSHLQHAALAALGRMPDGDALCHGDFHPYNVLIAKDGPVTIDWINATCGNPLADVARTSVVLQAAAARPSGLSWWQKRALRRFCALYQRRYVQLRAADPGELDAWQPIVAALRLNDDVPGERPWLLSAVEAGLS